MKPLLRVVLILDALLLLAFGLLFLLTPWASLYDALQLAQPQPALVGQAFGVALIGLAWLALHASFDGALVARSAYTVADRLRADRRGIDGGRAAGGRAWRGEAVGRGAPAREGGRG
jgi:hypothetical protein